MASTIHPQPEFGPPDATKKRVFWEIIDRIDHLDEWLDSKIENTVRDVTLQKSDFQLRTKTLRLFFRYQFIPATEETRSHFLIIIDGMILDGKRKPAPFAKYLQSLRLQLNDRKPGAEPQIVEWHEGTFPEGSSASCIISRIYFEKACTVRVTMALNDDYQALRYEVPEAIRRGLGVGPAQSLDELCLATLSYAHLRHLFTEKDRRYIRCDEALREVFSGIEMLPVWTLRQRLAAALTASQCLPCPLMFDLSLNTASSEEITSLQTLYNAHVLSAIGSPGEVVKSSLEEALLPRSVSTLYSKLNGKVFDVSLTERDESEIAQALQEVQAINVDSYEVNKRRRLASLWSQQAGQRATQCWTSAERLGRLAARLASSSSSQKPLRATGSIEEESGRCDVVQGITLLPGGSQGRDCLPLFPPFVADQRAGGDDLFNSGWAIRPWPSALHGLGAFRSANCHGLSTSGNAAVWSMIQSGNNLEELLTMATKIGAQVFPKPKEEEESKQEEERTAMQAEEPSSEKVSEEVAEAKEQSV
eukprot:scaffold2822_cov192-Ochromonas_danica.AAC.5